MRKMGWYKTFYVQQQDAKKEKLSTGSVCDVDQYIQIQSYIASNIVMFMWLG